MRKKFILRIDTISLQNYGTYLPNSTALYQNMVTFIDKANRTINLEMCIPQFAETVPIACR